MIDYEECRRVVKDAINKGLIKLPKLSSLGESDRKRKSVGRGEADCFICGAKFEKKTLLSKRCDSCKNKKVSNNGRSKK